MEDRRQESAGRLTPVFNIIGDSVGFLMVLKRLAAEQSAFTVNFDTVLKSASVLML